MSKALFSQSAQTDLLEAWLFIAEDNLGAADRVLDSIETEAKMLATQPLMGRARPELADGVRSWPTSTAYILFYLAGASGIAVIRVLHHARDIKRTLFLSTNAFDPQLSLAQSPSKTISMDAPAPKDAPIEIVSYSDDWPALFAAEKVLLQLALKPWLVANIEHIGSTAVLGLQAKPIIDIMVPVQDLVSSIRAIKSAQAVGYCYYPYKPDQMHWFCMPSPAVRTHHLHLVPWQSQLWQERIAFRDALRMSPSLAQEYGNLKLSLAAQHRLDREAYTQAKSTFVATVLKSCLAVAPRPPLPLA